VNFIWERLGDGVLRCRLPFLDITVGLVYGRAGAMLIDTGTTLTEVQAIAEDVQDIANGEGSHIVLTHNRDAGPCPRRRRGCGVRAGARRGARRGVRPQAAAVAAQPIVTNFNRPM
jgi:hypothetical protein